MEDKDFVFNPEDVPGDDSEVLFDVTDPDDEEIEEEPDDESDNSKRNSKKQKDNDPDDEDEDDEDDDDDEEDDDDFSDLGLDNPEDDDEADDDKSTTSIPDKFKGKTAKDIAKAYVNVERELGRTRNELKELKELIKNPPNKDKPEQKTPEPIDLKKVIDVNKLNDALLTGATPAEAILEAIAQSFNLLSKGAIQEISQLLENKDKEYRENYFNEIDQNREERKAAEPYLKEASRLAKKYREDWDIIKPVMQEAIANNPDLISSPADYEPLYKRIKKYLKCKGKLEELSEQDRRHKKTGGSFNSTRKSGKHVERNDEFSTIDKLFQD